MNPFGQDTAFPSRVISEQVCATSIYQQVKRESSVEDLNDLETGDNIAKLAACDAARMRRSTWRC